MSKAKQAEANIQTFMRIKPSKNPSGYFAQDDLEKSSLSFTLPSNYKSDYVNNSKLKHSFHFNGIIGQNASQEDVFKLVGTAAVQNALDGFNSTIFAYGQTGSGKTFTLTGGPEKYSDRGIIPRAISMLYSHFRSATDAQFKVYISYLEIYNEQGYDLLDPSHETKALEDLPKVKILEDEHGSFHLKNLSMHAADSEEDALNLLFLGDTNRAIAETPMNMASSRSHCMFSISLEAREAGSDKVRRSKLHLVDLAGSERVAKTNSSGAVLSEAGYINSSLFFLEMVIVALYEKATKGRTHIPYRNSMMTSVLRDSLGGNCKTIMIATMNPEASHTDESLSTCRFAQRVSLIKNKALINEELDPSVVIRRLKNELLTLREEISFLKGEAGEGDALSPQELDELKTACRIYCFDMDPNSTFNIGTLTLTKIRDAFAVMKNLVLECKAASTSNEKLIENSSGGSSAVTDEEVDNLKSLLLQRESEIAILVNMVKKGKTVQDVGRAVQRNSFSSNSSAVDNIASGKNGSVAEDATNQKVNSGGKSFARMQQEQQLQREKQREERIVKRHLFGVPAPEDKAIFDDAAASFEWFRERCSLNKSLEENKKLLKEKITEAKTMGERANQSRNTINYLKNSIEAIRREKVMERLHDADDGKTTNAGDSKQAQAESEEETTYRRAIDQEKVVYKESFEKLRVLKPEIEHIRKVIEKCRASMQGQFDQWYNNLHARGGHTGSGYHASNYSGGHEQSDDEARNSADAISINRTESKGSSDNWGGAGAKNGMLPNHQDNALFQAPAEAKDAGNMPLASSSMEVNEDIMAFYQAKEELLKRRAAENSAR